MAVSGTPNTVVQTEPAPHAMSPPWPGMPTVIVAVTFLLCASTRVTVPSPWFKVQMEPPPAARNLGLGPTGIVANTAPDGCVHGSQDICGATGDPDHALQLKHGLYEPAAMEIFWRALFVTGSMRTSVPASSVTIQTLSLAGGDSAFLSRRSNRKCGRDLVRSGIDSHHRVWLAAQRHPQTAKSKCQTRTGIARHGNDRNFLIGLGVDAVDRRGVRAGYPDSIIGDLDPVRIFTDLECGLGLEGSRTGPEILSLPAAPSSRPRLSPELIRAAATAPSPAP